MQDPRARAALDRIDRALSRIETVAAAPQRPAPEHDEVRRLREAHALLRKRVEGAIGEIDSLLDGTR